MFLDMQEHPDKYSDEQIEALLDELDREPDVESAWQKFSAEQNKRTKPAQNHASFLKIAASFIGILLVSGISFAAIHLWSHANSPSPKSEEEIFALDTTGNASLPSRGDVEGSPVIFDNVTLDTIAMKLATYYNMIADIRDKRAHDVRLHYKWHREDSLSTVVSDLNHFDRVNITIENNHLIVKP